MQTYLKKLVSRHLAATIFFGIIAIYFLPDSLSALEKAGDALCGAELTQQAGNIKSIFFGPLLTIAGIIGGSIAIFYSLFKTTAQPLFTYGLICLIVAFIPTVINKVFTLTLF